MASEGWGSPFAEPKELNHSALCFQTAVCGYVLFQASNYISDGSEYLLLIPSLAGIVGSIVLPILGAVPDGMMVLFSATGTDVVVMQESLKVGVGALAGSTVMLLTIPWFICVVFGRAPIDPTSGEAMYDMVKGEGKQSDHKFMKCGITFHKEIPAAAKMMIATSFIYFIIQVPAIATEGLFPKRNDTATEIGKEDKSESMWAIIGLVASILAFGFYLYKCYKEANSDKALEKIIEGIQSHEISLGAALKFMSEAVRGSSDNLDAPLTDDCMLRLKKVLRPFFAKYDVNGDSYICEQEFQFLLMDLGERLDQGNAKQMFKGIDSSGDGKIQFDEFSEHLQKYLMDAQKMENIPKPRTTLIQQYGIEDEEPEEMPEDLCTLTPDEQRKRILMRAFGMMGFGTALVLVFSDPMVDILAEIGKRLNVSPFYISFVLAPMASNASELVAAYNYAQKKTKKSLTTSISTLIGAACMNNTFCMSIFLVMVALQGLAWQFTAETIATMLVQWIIGILCLKTCTHTTVTAFFILACYPLCLFIVYFLENFCYMD